MQKRIESRIEHCLRSLAEKRIDTFLVLNGDNRRYLSGFTGEDTQCDESAGALFISEKDLILATDSRYELQASQEAVFYNILCFIMDNSLKNFLRTACISNRHIYVRAHHIR